MERTWVLFQEPMSGHSQLLVTPVLRDLSPSSGRCEHLHLHVHRPTQHIPFKNKPYNAITLPNLEHSYHFRKEPQAFQCSPYLNPLCPLNNYISMFWSLIWIGPHIHAHTWIHTLVWMQRVRGDRDRDSNNKCNWKRNPYPHVLVRAVIFTCGSPSPTWLQGRTWPGRERDEEKTDTQKLNWGELGFLMEKLQHTGSSACFLWAEQKGEGPAYSWTRRQPYYI